MFPTMRAGPGANGVLGKLSVAEMETGNQLLETAPSLLWQEMRKKGESVGIQQFQAPGLSEKLFLVLLAPDATQGERQAGVCILLAEEDIPRLPEGPRRQVEDYMRQLKESGSS